MSAAARSDARAAFATGAALALWALLVALQLGMVPPVRHAWAFNLWAYFPFPAGAALGAASLTLCFASPRAALIDAAGRSADAWEGLAPGARRALAAAGLITAGLLGWLLRERHLAGDSVLLTVAVREGWMFVLQEPGASFLMRRSARLGDALGLGTLVSLRLLSTACLLPALVLLAGAARHLVDRRLAPSVVAVVLGGGLVRIFAGHVEVYAPLLVALAGYLYAAFARLRGRAPWWVPPLALGVTIWMHLSAVVLVPSLFLLPWLAPDPEGAGARGRRLVGSALVCGLPLVLFFSSLLALGQGEDLGRAWERAVEVLGRSADPNAKRWWVRGWGSYPSIGTDVVFLSAPHLKYLANAAYLLCPASIPLLAVGAFARGRALVRDPASRFLLAAALPLVAYACLLRPFWGPFDWDLFSMTALVLAVWAAHALFTLPPVDVRAHLAVFVIGFQLAFVSVPFVAAGVGTARPAGPFQSESWGALDLLPARTPPPPGIAPWL